MKRIRILIVIPSLAGGGAERLVSVQLRHLDRERFEATLLLRHDRITYPIPDDVAVLCARAPAGPLGAARFLWAITRTLRSLRPDVVVSHLPFTNSLTALARGISRSRARHVAWVHNSLEEARESSAARRTSLRLQYYLGLRLAHHVVCCSEGVRDDFCAALRLPRGVTAAIANPVDVSRFEEAAEWRLAHYRPEPDHLRLVHMGRLCEQKGHRFLIQALAALSRRRSATLTLIGDGPLRAAIEAQAEERGVRGRVRFAGFLREPAMEIARHDIFVFPSLWEGLGIALAEAMALGVPVVASDCDHGPRELITDGVHGLLVPVGNVDALVEAIEQLAADRQRAAQVAANARRRILAEFSPEQKVRDFEQLCFALAGEPGRPGSACGGIVDRTHVFC